MAGFVDNSNTLAKIFTQLGHAPPREHNRLHLQVAKTFSDIAANPPSGSGGSVAAATSSVLGTVLISGTPTNPANPVVYVKEAVDTLLLGKSDVGHNHTGVYFRLTGDTITDGDPSNGSFNPLLVQSFSTATTTSKSVAFIQIQGNGDSPTTIYRPLIVKATTGTPGVFRCLQLNAVKVLVEYRGTGTCGTGMGVEVELNNLAAGTVTDMWGVSIQTANNSGGGTVGRAAAFRSIDLTAAFSNVWGLYLEGATMRNYLAGKLGIGVLNPAQALEVSGTVIATTFQGSGASLTGLPWGSLTGVPSIFPPSAHKTTHSTGGTDALVPGDIGAVSLAGQLGGSGASPDVRGIRETGGPTLLTFGAVADGKFFRRSGTSVVGAGSADLNFSEPAAAIPNPFDDFFAFQDSSAGGSRSALFWRSFILANFENTYGWFEDFNNAPTAVGGGLVGASNGTGAGLTRLPTDDVTAVGVMEVSTGTTTTGRSALTTQGECFALGNGRLHFWGRVKVPILSDGTETFTIWSGLGDLNTGNPADGVQFRYTHSANSGNWQGVCRSNSVESVLNSSVAPTTAAYQRLEFEVNAAGSSVQFWADGVSLGTITTNIPTGLTRLTGPQPAMIVKSAGTTARVVRMDYTGWLGELVSTR